MTRSHLQNSKREERERMREVHHRLSVGPLLCAICFPSEICSPFSPRETRETVLRQPQERLFPARSQRPPPPSQETRWRPAQVRIHLPKGREHGGVRGTLGITEQGFYHPCLHQRCLLMAFLYRSHQLKASSQEAPLGISINCLPFPPLISVC